MRPAHRRSGGFTLLEVLVAFVIAALALGVMFDGVLGGMRAASTAARTEEAVALARSRLAETLVAVSSGAITAVSDQEGDDGNGFHWRVQVRPGASVPMPRSDQTPGCRPQCGRARGPVFGDRHHQLDRRPRSPAGAAGRRAPGHARCARLVSGIARPRRDGFTLLEILVALVVLGFLLAGLSEGVRFGLRAWGMQTRGIARQADMDATYRALRRLIEEADPGEANENATVLGQPHTLALRTLLPPAAEAAGPLESDVGIGVDADHHLVLRASPHPHAERLGPPPSMLRTVLLDGVDHVDFGYFRATGHGVGWQKSWNDPDPPALIRLHIVFSGNDTQRHWPDLVAAPARERQEQ